jgi:hypothetical protein
MQARRWLILPVALCSATVAFAACAQDAERFEVRNAYVELVNGSWQLDVRLDLALAQAAQQAFEEGVPLTLKLEVEATVERRLLLDEDVVSMTREWQLAYDAIAERFVVTDGATGAHVSHRHAGARALSRISGITIADTASCPEGQRFDARARDFRDRRLPAAACQPLEGWCAESGITWRL